MSILVLFGDTNKLSINSISVVAPEKVTNENTNTDIR